MMKKTQSISENFIYNPYLMKNYAFACENCSEILQGGLF